MTSSLHHASILTWYDQPLKNDRWRIPKSRYASNSTYISQDPQLRKEYMDPDLVVDQDLKHRLMDGGMDDLLATHFAHLFIRDPLVIFAEDLKELDLTKTDHFENLQSTNWQHIRFKPPPPDKDTGWRVEFRPMEIQVTDFENAAFAIFIVLITRAILSFDLNFYIPIPLTTQNMETAHAGNAVLVAPPGAGKTTTVPLALLDASWRAGGRIVMLEPRRLAARAAATRMASLIGEAVGETVGFRTRIDSAVSARTRIEVVTTGLLVRRLLADPRGRAPWYNATGTSLYVMWMLVAALALRAL